MTRFVPPRPRRIASWLGPLALAAALPLAAQVPVDSDGPHIVYLPSGAADAADDAIVDRFVELGFYVEPISRNGRSDLGYSRRVADHVRLMMRQGVRPGAITVVGVGPSSRVATLASARVMHRRVNYALLGHCNPLLRTQYRFRMSGRVLGVRDAADPDSHSCRPLWQESPKVSERQDLVLHTRYGAALFDRPNAEWVGPVADWGRRGEVSIGRIRVGALDAPARVRDRTRGAGP